MKKKKIIFGIFILFVFAFFTYLVYDSIKFDKTNSKTTKEKAVRVTFVEIDKDKVTDENFKDSSYLDYFLSGFSIEEDLKKEGKYYVATIGDISDIAFKRIKKITTGLNDTQANLVNDVKYDEKTRKIFIPTKYYDDSKYSAYDGATIRLELVNAITEEELNKISYDVNITKFTTKSKTNTSKFYFEEPKISVFKFKKGKYISKKDMKIYINDSKTPLSEKKYKWDNETGIISFDSYTFYLNKVDIKIKKTALLKNFFFSIFNFGNAKAEDANSNDISFEVTDTGKGGIAKLKGATIKKMELEYYYDASEGYYHNGEYSKSGDVPDSIVDSSIQANATIFKDTVRTAEYWSFYIYVPELKFSKTYKYDCDKDGKNCKTGTVTATVKVNRWLRSACDKEDTKGTSPSRLLIDFTLSDATSESLFIEYNSTNHVTTQFAAGGFRTTSTIYELKIQKKIYDETTNTFTDWKKKGVVFRIYSGFKGVKSDDSLDDSDCNGDVIDEKTTNGNGRVTFSGLTQSGAYCVKEIFNESTYKSTVSREDYARDANCNGYTEREGGYTDKVLTAYTTDLTNGTEYGNSYCNIKRKYCLAVKKIDAETGCAVNGIKFRMNSTEKTTSGNGLVIYNNLGWYSNKSSGTGIIGGPNPEYHYVYEMSEHGTKGTLTGGANCSGTFKYWNDSDSSNPISFADSELTEMKRTVNNGQISYNDCTDEDFENNSKFKSQYDHKQYYCAVVKKIDSSTRKALSGARFMTSDGKLSSINSDGKDDVTKKDGLAYFFLGTDNSTKTVIETQTPAGYAAGSQIEIIPVLMPQGTTDQGNKGKTSFVDNCKSVITGENFVEYNNSKQLLNWYKENENGKAVSGARFNARYTDENNSYKYIKVKMSDSGNRVKVDYPENSPQKKCYVFDFFATETQKNNLQSTEQNPVDLVSDDNGEVCIIGVPNNGKKVGDNTQAQGAYTIVETKPAKYHTFSNKKTIQLNLTTSIQAKTSNNTFTNYETEFEFTKDVSSGDSNTEIIINGVKKTLKELTTEELQKIEFNIYNSNGDILHFVKNSDGTYDFAGNDKDAPSNLTGASSALYLNKNRKLKVLHLPEGTYSIKESQGSTCTNSTDSSKCVGYYYPNYSSNSSHQFTITDCSSSKATSCTTYGVVTQKLTNTPTEITFTKKDFYSYYDAADKNKSEENVKFENDKERNDFDKIVFKIKDSSGRYLTLKKVADHGNCSTDDSYSEYRYVSSDQTDKNGTELHTCGGHIKITNLCRGNEYTVEEVSVPDGSVYVKENTTSTPTSAKYQIPCTEGDTTHKTTTNIINDKPTRVRFEKRDSKYNYLIDDETTTFEVYKCKKGTECHPADYKTVAEREKNGMTLVKFSPRAVITKDEEDPTDAAGLAGVEVYKKISDSDVSKGQKYVTSLHPYKGLLILRYLESNDSNSSYVLLETVAPYNYSVPSGRNAETRFTVTNTTVKVDEIDVPNKPTSLIIRKYSDDGKLLPGAEFKVYEGTSCNSNLSAMNQPKKLLKLKTIRDGVYENRPEQDTDTVLTCTDKDGAKCSDIAVNNMTSLTYKNYQNTWADFNESLTNDNKKVQIKEGEALIQYLEYDHCYIIEETKAPKGYSLPKNDEDRFTMVTIPKNTEYVSDTYKTLINKPTPFTFYKYDEYNNLLDGAEFKLQKLDSNKKYHDITVTKEETETGVFYKVDKSTDNKVITTKDGKATVYYIEEGQYRIVETKAAPGKELGKNPNVATFFVDSAGNVYGNSIIVNKAKTETLSFTSSASAEFLIWNRTGQTVIRYGLIISSIVAVIVALMIALRIKKKSE